MQKIRADLRQALLLVASAAFAFGCSSTDDGTDVEGGGDAFVDGSSDGIVDGHAESSADGDGTTDGSCDPAAMGCCCDGDALKTPVCSADGTFVCPSGYNHYLGADCTRTCGPCQLSCHDTGVAETSTGDADAGEDGGACDTTGSCCCDGDIAGPVSCDASGALVCTSGLTLFHGDDCTRPCGPCTFAPSCLDSGVDGG